MCYSQWKLNSAGRNDLTLNVDQFPQLRPFRDANLSVTPLRLVPQQPGLPPVLSPAPQTFLGKQPNEQDACVLETNADGSNKLVLCSFAYKYPRTHTAEVPTVSDESLIFASV
jgi:hypothetical protein